MLEKLMVPPGLYDAAAEARHISADGRFAGRQCVRYEFPHFARKLTSSDLYAAYSRPVAGEPTWLWLLRRQYEQLRQGNFPRIAL